MMEKKKKFLSIVSEFLFDPAKSLKDRCFVMFVFCMILSFVTTVISGIIMGDSLPVIIGMILFGVAFLGYAYIAVKHDHVNRARVISTIVVAFVIMPILFFARGGVYAGIPIAMLVNGFFIITILDGKLQKVLCSLNGALVFACIIVSYIRPELVTVYSRKMNYVNLSIQFVLAAMQLILMLAFQTSLIRRESESARKRAEELEELNKSQSRFFSSMSHEIRTPINTVLGLNEIILRQEDASEEIRKDASNIQGAGKMLLALINDILDVSKIEAGKMDIVPVNYNVSSLLSEIVNMIWLKAEEKGLQFRVDIDPDVPDGLFGDEVRIKQVLINLLNNAVKYTKEGSVTLHMECEFPTKEEVLLKITVSDTGMGIQKEALPHLFDSFQRVDEEKNRYIEGTGLGLSIVKQLVELMNGEITVSSVYGEGSVFSVELKQGISSEKRIGDLNITGAGGIGKQEKFEHSFHAPNARILIVDDNEMNLQVEEKLLAGTEMTVDLALSGADALIQTLRHRYDAIFMDHLMPEMDGIECFKKIRTQKGGLNPNTPVIVLTANAGGENIELYNNTGFDGYLVKPVSGRQLEDMLLTHLPSEKVVRKESGEMTGASMSTASRYARKKPVVIATSTMIDVPDHVLRELNISVIPYTVITDEGVFYDTIDIDSEELVRYMRDEKKIVSSEPPTEDDLTAFFIEELKKAHQIIYITLLTGSSREYGRAEKAAKSFENVTVFNSECLSSCTGILVMIAGRLAQQNVPADRIVAELEEAKKRIRCSFVIKSTDVMARRERISPFMNNVLNTLWLRPMLRTKDDKLGVGRFLFGNERKCYEEYIQKALPSNVNPDTSFIFVTYAGLEEEDLLWIEEKLCERMKFDHVVFQKASAAITSNCGEGTFGLLYIVKGDRNYNLGGLFADKEEEEFTEEELLEENVEEAEEQDVVTTEETVQEEKELEWYEKIPGLDADAAVKNSGSKDAFLSVLKIYYDSYEAKVGEIRGFFDAQDWTNYTIKVHALKSSSRLVGALVLGDKAEALEMAGKQTDTEFIFANHQSLMEEYSAIHDALRSGFETEEELPEIPESMLTDAYASLSEFAQMKEFEMAKMVMDSLGEYRLPPEDEERVKQIKTCLSNMDWDKIIDLTKEGLT